MTETQGLGEREQSEKRNAAAQMLEAAFDFAYTPIAYLDRNLRFVRVNLAYAAADERTPEDFVGKGHFELYPDAENERIFRKVIATGEPHACVARPFSYAYRPDRGTTYWDWTLVPLKDAAGDVQGALLTLQDVTHRVRSEHMLAAQRDLGLALGMARSTEEALERVLETACCFEGIEAGGVYAVAADTGALDLVAHRGLSRTFVDTVSHHDPDSPQARLALAGTPVYVRYEELATSADRKRRSEGLRALAIIPIKHEAEVVAVLNLTSRTSDKIPEDARLALEAIATQIGALVARLRADASQRAFDEQLRQTQKLESLGMLAGGIAHDFNNLLVGIVANADIARASLPDESPARPPLIDLKLAAQRAADLARQMLAYAGRSPLATEPVDLETMIAEMRALLAASLPKPARVTYELTGGLPSVEVDVSQLRQVVMNLIINAAEALGEGGGNIVVRTSSRTCDRAALSDTVLADPLPEGEYVALEVEDDGCGMSPEAQRRIFDPFFSTKRSGRGFGLATVLGIVRHHDGAISLWSQPGQGTRFTVLLPASSAAPVRPSDVAHAAEELAPSGTVLIVDDEEVVRHVAGHILEQAGMHVVTAADGPEALERVESHGDDIDLVLLDLTMPKMSGVEVRRRLATMRPELPVLITSGYDADAVLREHAELASAHLLQKPFDVTQLLAAVRSALEPRSP